MCSQLVASAVGIEVKRGSGNRRCSVKRIRSCRIAGGINACVDRSLQGSGAGRCKLSGLVQNFSNCIRETSALHTVHDDLTNCNHTSIRLVPCLTPDNCCQKIQIAGSAIEA